MCWYLLVKNFSIHLSCHALNSLLNYFSSNLLSQDTWLKHVRNFQIWSSSAVCVKCLVQHETGGSFPYCGGFYPRNYWFPSCVFFADDICSCPIHADKHVFFHFLSTFLFCIVTSFHWKVLKCKQTKKKLNKLAAKHLICWCFSQDAFETAARAEGGLSLDGGNAADAKELEDEVGRSKYHHSVCVLKPIRSTSKYVLKLLSIVHFISVSKP